MPAAMYRVASFWIFYQFFSYAWCLVLEWKLVFVPSTRKHFIHTTYSVKPRAAPRSRRAQYSWLTLYQEFPFISTNGSTLLTSSFSFCPATFPVLFPSWLRKDHLTLFWGGEIIVWRGSQFLPLCANGGALRCPPKAFDGIRRTHSSTHQHTLIHLAWPQSVFENVGCDCGLIADRCWSRQGLFVCSYSM